MRLAGAPTRLAPSAPAGRPNHQGTAVHLHPPPTPCPVPHATCACTKEVAPHIGQRPHTAFACVWGGWLGTHASWRNGAPPTHPPSHPCPLAVLALPGSGGSHVMFRPASDPSRCNVFLVLHGISCEALPVRHPCACLPARRLPACLASRCCSARACIVLTSKQLHPTPRPWPLPGLPAGPAQQAALLPGRPVGTGLLALPDDRRQAWEGGPACGRPGLPICAGVCGRLYGWVCARACLCQGAPEVAIGWGGGGWSGCEALMGATS